jgi:hypothetical protein
MTLFVSWPLLAQKGAPSFPRDGAKQLLDNQFVTIWDVTYEKGKSSGMRERVFDQVAVTLGEGAVKVIRPDSTWTTEFSNFGAVRFESKGTKAAEEGASDKPRRDIVIELKNYAVPKLDANLTTELKAKGMPGQFPRAEATKLLETDRVIVWDNKYRLGRGEEHAHYHQVVGVWIEAGTLNGSPRTVGPVNFRAPGPPHQEEAQTTLRAIFVEYKD